MLAFRAVRRGATMVAMPDSAIRHTERLQAGRDEVFDAWTDPAKLALWFAPSSDYVIRSVRAEARTGGTFCVELASPDGSIGRIEGTYREVARPERLSFTSRLLWGDEVAEDGADEPVVTIELTDRDGATDLSLVHEGLVVPEMRKAFEQAWYGCLSRIPAAFDGALTRFSQRVTRSPRCRSSFGGFWVDFENAFDRIRGKEELGLLTAEDAALFRQWNERGFVVLPGAVDATEIEALSADVERAWGTPDSELEVESFENGQRVFRRVDPRYRSFPHKVLDLHGHSEAARGAIFAPSISRFLSQLFERPPMAFQSLLFDVGTEQDLHQDTAYVLVSSPMEFVGCWIALEDVREGSGELHYYEGSHRIPEYVWPGGARAKPYDYRDEREFLAWVRDKPRELGLPLTRFLPKKGDALIWHADLVHGGSPRVHPQLTRKSFVTHFCPVDVDPEWFGTTDHSKKLDCGPARYYCYRRKHSAE